MPEYMFEGRVTLEDLTRRQSMRLEKLPKHRTGEADE
jgi:hypothetical protein